jgi:hypothetical protein
MERYIDLVGGHVPAVAFMGLFTLAILVAPAILARNPLRKFPLLGKEHGSYPKRVMAFLYHGESMYQEGYRMFKSSVYRITTLDGVYPRLVACVMLTRERGAHHDCQPISRRDTAMSG